MRTTPTPPFCLLSYAEVRRLFVKLHHVRILRSAFAGAGPFGKRFPLEKTRPAMSFANHAPVVNDDNGGTRARRRRVYSAAVRTLNAQNQLCGIRGAESRQTLQRA